jgi:hypothetical protein
MQQEAAMAGRKISTAKRKRPARKKEKKEKVRWSHDWTMSVPDAGKKYLGLGRNASYEAAGKGQIPTITVNKTMRVPVPLMERMLGADGPVSAE